LIDFVKRHASSNKMAIRVDYNKKKSIKNINK